MPEFDATKMDNAAKQADAELGQIKELHQEGVKAVQDWMKKWFNSAGYKRLGKILADRWEEPG